MNLLRNLRRKGGFLLDNYITAFFLTVLANVVSYFVCKWLEK